MASRIALDRYVYEDIYPAFKAATDEKEITANINRRLLNYLSERKLVLTGDSPANVADIGSGPCDTLIKYLRGVPFAPGFVLRATDFIPEYADARDGEALETLRTAQAQGIIKIVDFSTRAGDAFGGNLRNLLSAAVKPDAQTSFQLIFASHVFYHAETFAQVQRLIADMANLLDPTGVCVLYHIANQPRTFQEYRARFGGHAGIQEESNTGAVTINDPPAQIAEACSAVSLPLFQAEFIAKLRFGNLDEAVRQTFKEPRRYDELAESNPAAYEDLKKLYFVVQRAPVEFAADSSDIGLEAFIDEVCDVIQANQGYLPLAERIQVFCRADAPALLRQTIPAALAAAVD